MALMEAAEAELATAVNESYAEGYKAAALRYAPDAALYKALAADLERTLETERKKNRFFWPAIGVSAGLSLAAGFLCSFLIMGH
jgi:hypothetical protein